MGKDDCGTPEIPPGWDPKTGNEVVVDAEAIATAIAEAIKECFDPDGNGDFNVELDLAGLGEAVATAIAEAFGGEDGTLDVEVDLGPLLEALEGCLTVGNCVDPETGEPVPVIVDNSALIEAITSCLSFQNCTDPETGEPIPIVVTLADTPLDSCVLIPRDVDGCAVVDGERCPIVGRAVDIYAKDGQGQTAELVGSLDVVWYHEGQPFTGFVEFGECPCVAQPACISCWHRHVLDTETKTDLFTLFGISDTATIAQFNLEVHCVGDERTPPQVIDCKGNPSDLACGDTIRISEAPCADWSGPFQTIVTRPGDRITIEAVTLDCTQ